MKRNTTEVHATFRPNDGQPPWSGQLRQTVTTRMIKAGNELIEGSKKVEWDHPKPPVDYFPTANGSLEIEGKSPCEVWWGNGRFNHSGGFTGD